MARRKKPTEGPHYYTTYQVGKLLGVSLPTVVNWIRSDLLPAHRTPGGHRRIAHPDIVAFAKKQNYPLQDSFIAEGKGQRRVLIVDDDDDFTQRVSEMLSLQDGIKVATACSGFQAGLVVGQFKPTLIFMDIMMPDMDGFEALNRLRTEVSTQDIPVIACTGLLTDEIKARIKAAGFNEYLSKPCSNNVLVALVSQYC